MKLKKLFGVCYMYAVRILCLFLMNKLARIDMHEQNMHTTKQKIFLY